MLIKNVSIFCQKNHITVIDFLALKPFSTIWSHYISRVFETNFKMSAVEINYTHISVKLKCFLKVTVFN